MEKLILIKVKGKGSYKRTCIEPEQFKRLFESGMTKKSLNRDYNIGHRIWKESILQAGYNAYQIEKFRQKKLTKGNRGCKSKKIKDRIIYIDKFFPIREAYDNYSDDPDTLAILINSINDELYEVKTHLRQVKKIVNQKLKRQGKNPINFVQNSWEYRVKKVLISLGIDYLSSFKVGKNYYDFLLPEYNTLLEVDSAQYHSKESNKPKNEVAKNAGYKLIRIKEKDIKYVHIIKDKISKKLGL
jgi:very-short-patch-repair endonuclease